MESLKAQDTPAVILLSEYARRIQDMSRTLGESFAPETETTLVLNRDNPIIQRLGSLSDENKNRDNPIIQRLGSLSDENKELVCQQVYDLAQIAHKPVYDLAQIAHKPLSAEEMARFMQRNVKILQLLTEEK